MRLPRPLLLLVLGLVLVVSSGLFLRAQLPPIYALRDYRPLEASRIISEDGVTVGLFATERRTVVPFAQIPTHVVRAFLAAEDADFYQHEGIDWPGVARALLKNLHPGAHLQGASTITQQTVKTLVLGPERSIWRKVREAVLARRLEKMLTKDEILAIYLNQIYFGNGAWGLGEAALTSFGRPVETLSLEEAAILAAAPKNPRRFTLSGDRKRLKERQNYVLRQMARHGWAEPEAVARAQAAPLPDMAPTPEIFAAAGGYVEQVRRLLEEKLPSEQIYGQGLKIYVPLNAKQQLAAAVALRQSVEDVTRSHGYLSDGRRLEVDVLGDTLAKAHAAWHPPTQQACLGCAPLRQMWDFSAVRLGGRGAHDLAGSLLRVPLEPFERAQVPVVEVQHHPPLAVVDLGGELAELPLARMAWARPYSPTHATPRPSWPGQVLRRGDLITVDVVRVGNPNKAVPPGQRTQVALVPPTKLQGALVAIAPHSHEVRALVGGARAQDALGLNRAVQAHRQPGSAFKPIIYAAGLLTQSITPASICNDAPVSIVDPWTGNSWRPENYEDGRYDGPMTYRRALALSKNTCSVRLLQRMGPEQAIAVARATGAITAEESLPKNLTLALGTGEVTPLNLTNAMASLVDGGQFAPPSFVRRVLSADGEDLWPQAATPQRLLPSDVAYITVNMMQSVVEEGTARRARQLARPLAGKTGTSQAARDVWFTGMSPHLAATTWLGFDDNASLGRHTGASAALPAWIRFMGAAHATLPATEFACPANVVHQRIDADTGLFVAADATRFQADAPAAPAGAGAEVAEVAGDAEEGAGSGEGRAGRAASAGPHGPRLRDEVFVPGTEPRPTPAHLPSLFLEEDVQGR